MTTDDYVWTYQQVIKPENKYPYLENFGDITAFVAQDPKTLVVTLKDAFSTGLITAGSAITPLPRHIWEKLDWSDPTKNPEINAPTVASGLVEIEGVEARRSRDLRRQRPLLGGATEYRHADEPELRHAGARLSGAQIWRRGLVEFPALRS